MSVLSGSGEIGWLPDTFDKGVRYHDPRDFSLPDGPSYQLQHHNIAPSQKVLTIRFNPETWLRSLDALQWGLIPYWAKDPKIGYRTINAPSESVDMAPRRASAQSSRNASGIPYRRKSKSFRSRRLSSPANW